MHLMPVFMVLIRLNKFYQLKIKLAMNMKQAIQHKFDSNCEKKNIEIMANSVVFLYDTQNNPDSIGNIAQCTAKLFYNLNVINQSS